MSWKDAHILFKFPARERKGKLFEKLDQYYGLMVDKKNFTFLISIDHDDEILNTPEVLERLSEYKNLNAVVGESKGKIFACNRDIQEHEEPWNIVVLVSDDMMPKIQGYDMHIRKGFKKHFPDFDGVLHFNDGHQGDKLNTLCILGKKYYNRFGYIYHPSYVSLYCDNEFMEVSRALNKVHYSPMVIIEHQHWAWGFGKMDGLYQKNEGPIHVDKTTFEDRKNKRFALKQT